MASSKLFLLTPLSYINEEFNSYSSANTMQDQDNFFPSNPVVAHATDAAGGEEGSEQAQKRQKT